MKNRARALVVAGLLIAAMLVMTMPVKATVEVHTNIFTGQTIQVNLESWPEEQGYVFYWPQEQGTRTVEIWHQLWFDPLERGIVSFYWKDMSIPNDQWHYWTRKDFGLPYPYFNAKTELYSGSKYIAYRFVITHYYDFTMPIYVRVY
jgi:hypothetical protein